MREVLEAFPGAQRALFRRYHIGGCSSCGFEPSETLEQVCSRHNVLDLQEVLDHLLQAEELDRKLTVKPKDVADLLKAGKVKLLDVRQEFEREAASIEGSQLVTQELVDEAFRTWPKDTPIVFYCHRGSRSLDAAAYFLGHGFSDVRSMDGGIDAWSQEIDQSVPRYRF
jgi:rhodanese-related sulfurtransferase